jgi:hypothetical protein
MKRITPLLVAVGLCLLLGSGNAFACKHCTFDRNNPDCSICVTRISGGDYCQFSPPDCVFCEEIGICGGGAPVGQLPLATQYTVASVERLDEQRAITATGPVKNAQLAPKSTRTR